MSDTIREECGLAIIRLRKPLSHYQEKYGSALWGFNKLFLLMEKQHNRGQDGAGIGALKLNVNPGEPYLFRKREIRSNSLNRIFNTLQRQFAELVESGRIQPKFAASVKKHFEFGSEIYLGHLRYGTSGGYRISACHPYVRRSNWPTRNLMLAGNFNLTNTPALNQQLISRGQHPIFDTDTQTLLEEIGYHLDEQHTALYHKFRREGLSGKNIAVQISRVLDPAAALRNASVKWDGGYALAGIIGNGDVFAFRDPAGIRPLYWFQNEEAVGFASERAPLMTVFNLEQNEILEVNPGTAVVVKGDGNISSNEILPPVQKQYCSFERIYFSRGNDPEIYRQRKALGSALACQILDAVEGNLEHTVFSFVPNTAEIAYYGLKHELIKRQVEKTKRSILEFAAKGEVDKACLDKLFHNMWLKTEKAVLKDIKLRTFISQERGRDQLASHVYDISYGSVPQGDNLVCIDDSIVRGTTLKHSIIKILSRYNPKKIIIASTAPQIRYPDCYGIDMSQLDKFIAFQAAVSLLIDKGEEGLLEEVYHECRSQLRQPLDNMDNVVKRIYDRFSNSEISTKITKLVTPSLPNWRGEVQIIFQNIENLHNSLGTGYGDWYFTGNYPTPGGYRVLNKAYVNYYENKEGRSY